MTTQKIIRNTDNDRTRLLDILQAVQKNFGCASTVGPLNHVEVGIRAYDPCLFCATYAIGQMRLVATLEDNYQSMIEDALAVGDADV